MKKYILFFVFACASIGARAQGGYNYYEWGIGVNASYMRGYDDLERQVYHPGGSIGLVYNYSPYLPVSLDFQFGTIEGGGRTPDLDKYGRYSKNNFKALVLHADLQMGEIMNYNHSFILNFIKNFYIGSGFGAISNNMADIQRTNLYAENEPTEGPHPYVFPHKDKSINLLVPIRFGYEFKLFDSYDQVAYAITLGYEQDVTFGEGLDGYRDASTKFKNNAPDQYRQFTIGIKYNFGNTVSYSKLIRNFKY